MSSEPVPDVGASLRIADAIGALAARDDFAPLAKRSVGEVRRLLGAAACSVATLDGDVLTFIAADGAGAAAIIGVTVPVGTGIAGWAAATGQSLAVRDVHADPRFARDVAEATGFLPSAIVAVPLTYRSNVVGLIEVLDPTDDIDRCMALLGAVADPLGASLGAGRRLRGLGAALLDDATDPATGVRPAAPESTGQDLAEVVRLLARLSNVDDAQLRMATAIVTTVLDQHPVPR